MVGYAIATPYVREYVLLKVVIISKELFVEPTIFIAIDFKKCIHQ